MLGGSSVDGVILIVLLCLFVRRSPTLPHEDLNLGSPAGRWCIARIL